MPLGVVPARVAVKLRRVEGTGPLHYRLGSAWGRADLAEGVIAAEDVGPWFERWTWIELPPNPSAPAGGELYLQVQLAAADSGGYEWFGTATVLPDRPEVRIHFGYAPGWSEVENAEPPTFENPMNLDYGTTTPSYGGGMVLDQDAAPVTGLSLAFRVEGAGGHPAVGEERFAFADQLTGPLFTRSVRRRDVVPTDGEIALDDGWAAPSAPSAPSTPGTSSAPDAGSLVGRAVAEFGDFLRIAMECPLRGGKPFRLAVDPTADLPGAEAFELDVTEQAVTLTAGTELGLMRGLHYAEALMRLRRAPILPLGRHVRSPRWTDRITCAPFGTRRELTGSADAYSDEVLARISRAGCNGIWILAELEELGHSAVYPELNDGVANVSNVSQIWWTARRGTASAFMCTWKATRSRTSSSNAIPASVARRSRRTAVPRSAAPRFPKYSSTSAPASPTW